MRITIAVVLTLLIAVPAAEGARHLITGKDIKDGSITTRDLAKSARPKPGPTGETGPVGPSGPQGVPGATSSLRIQRIEGASVSVPAGSSFPTATATCPPGTVVTGGGFQADPGNNFAVSRSIGIDQTWYITARNQGSFAGDARAIVYCAG
jgi:hypothetical protein